MTAGPANDNLIELATIHLRIKADLYEAQAFGLDGDALIEHLKPALDETRRLANALEKVLDEAKAKVAKAEKEIEREAARAARRVQTIAGGIAAETFSDGFDPHGCFVYLLWGSDPEQPLYVGKSTNVLARLGSHLGDRSKRSQVERVSFIRCETEPQMDTTEWSLIQRYQPPLNTMGIRDVPATAKGAR